MQGSVERARLKSYLVPFLAAFIAFCVFFVLMDTVLMQMQGLSLLYDK